MNKLKFIKDISTGIETVSFEEVVPNNRYMMSGNQISVGALDLNQDFSNIAKTLDDIANVFFKLEAS